MSSAKNVHESCARGAALRFFRALSHLRIKMRTVLRTLYDVVAYSQRSNELDYLARNNLLSDPVPTDNTLPNNTIAHL